VIFPQSFFAEESLNILDNNISDSNNSSEIITKYTEEETKKYDVIKENPIASRKNHTLKKIMITIDDGPSKFSVSIADELDKL
jgi:peptidoglycan/xylan/chitin deacetylase (PgdA/CDA1 family)